MRHSSTSFRRALFPRFSTPLLALFGLTLAASVSAATITVTSPADVGTGTLREAITTANGNGQPDTIVFSSQLVGLLTPLQPLPALTEGGTTIFGDRNGDNLPDIILDGSLLPKTAASTGLVLSSANNAVRALVLQNFGGAGVQVTGASATGNQVLGNQLLNNGTGVQIDGGASNTLVGSGSSVAGSLNVISGSSAGAGVLVTGAGTTSNSILSNQIGVTPDASKAQANQNGILVDAGAANTLISGNLLSGNTQNGVYIRNAGGSTTVSKNRIGVSNFGVTAIPNGADGIRVENSTVTLGGSTSGDGNQIAGNTGNGIELIAPPTAVAYGNSIGLTSDAGAILENGGSGVVVSGIKAAAGTIRIGGPTPGQGNYISGNHLYGVDLKDAGGVVVQGNLIGLGASGKPLGNGGSGILMEPGTGGFLSGNTIGGVGAGESNVISANGRLMSASLPGDGITVTGSGHFITGNQIGSDAAGTNSNATGNAGNGIQLSAGSHDVLVSVDHVTGNKGSGIFIGGMGDRPTGNTVVGGTLEFNGASGIQVGCADGNTFGGKEQGTANVLQSNAGDGVFFRWDSACVPAGTKNLVIRSSISNNGGLGINLSNAPDDLTSAPLPASTPENPAGVEGLLKAPVIQSVRREGDTLEVIATYPGDPTHANVEVFQNDAADPSGFGEGATFMAEVYPNDDGSIDAPFEWTPGRTGYITARAYDDDGNTSEFSNAVAVPACDSDNPAVGDPSGDCKMDVSDAISALQIAVGIVDAPAGVRTAADVNKDGKVNVQDALLILQVVAGVISGFPQ